MEGTQITYYALGKDDLSRMLLEAETRGEKRGYDQAMKELEKPVNAKEVAKWLGVHESTVRRWTSEGEISSHKIGGANMYYLSEILPKKQA